MKIIYWRLVALVWMGGIWYLSNQPDLSSGLSYDFWLRKAAHVSEYAILMFLLYMSLEKLVSNKYRVWWSVLLSVLYASSDEWHQTFVVGRHGAIGDVVIDSIGILVMMFLIFWQTKKASD